MRSEADTRRSNNFRVGKARGEASGRNVLWLRFPRFAQSKCRCENRSCHFARPVLQMSLRESFLPPLPPRTSNVAARIVPAASPAPYFKCRCENRSCRLSRPVLQMSLRESFLPLRPPVLQMSLRESFLPPLPPRTSNVAARIVPAASPAPYFKCHCEVRSKNSFRAFS